MSQVNSMRRAPQQERSRQRVTHLLETAAQTFDELGYDAATTNAIAARAGIAIGSLYQFFPNKEAIKDALVERYLSELEAVFNVTGAQSITERVEQSIDKFVRFDLSHTGFRALFIDSALTQRVHATVVGGTERLLETSALGLDSATLHQTATVCIAMLKGMLKLSESPDNLAEDMAVAEVKRAMIAYVRAVVVYHGLPLPADLQPI